MVLRCNNGNKIIFKYIFKIVCEKESCRREEFLAEVTAVLLDFTIWEICKWQNGVINRSKCVAVRTECVCVWGGDMRGWTNINVWEKINLSASKALCKAASYQNIW